MARENYVEVELIKNPSVKRTMNINSFKMNQKKWRLQAGQSLDTAPVKKKDVEPVVNVFSKVEDTVKPESGVIDALRAQYEAKFGKVPDKRFNISRLTKEING